jgi:glycerol kinase
VDGGMTVNREFMQLQADTFNKKVIASELDTCWGVAKGVLVSKKIEFEEVK